MLENQPDSSTLIELRNVPVNQPDPELQNPEELQKMADNDDPPIPVP